MDESEKRKKLKELKNELSIIKEYIEEFSKDVEMWTTVVYELETKQIYEINPTTYKHEPYDDVDTFKYTKPIDIEKIRKKELKLAQEFLKDNQDILNYYIDAKYKNIAEQKQLCTECSKTI